MAKDRLETDLAADVPRFDRQQLLESERYRDRRDALNVLLTGNDIYTYEQVDTMLDDFMRKEVS